MKWYEIYSFIYYHYNHCHYTTLFLKTKLYKGVIEEVIRNVRNDFVNMGVDEQVLYDLQMVRN